MFILYDIIHVMSSLAIGSEEVYPLDGRNNCFHTGLSKQEI